TLIELNGAYYSHLVAFEYLKLLVCYNLKLSSSPFLIYSSSSVDLPMGVRGLWNILAPVQEYRPLAELGGEIVAIDLSIWVCSDISIQQNSSVVLNLYLRNLFFRTLNLLRQNTLPVMVLDGVAPNLKANTIIHRLESKDRNTLRSLKPANIVQRLLLSFHFFCSYSIVASYLPRSLISSLSQLVNACITNDGDAFLYGAVNVYRHFSMDTRDASVRVYRSSRIRKELKLSQYRLALLGILLGCDYWPSGVLGLGNAGIGRLLDSIRPLKDEELMNMIEWIQGHTPQTESELRQSAPLRFTDNKILQMWFKISRSISTCPVHEVLNEFLATPEKRSWRMPSATKLRWKRPDPRAMISFCASHLDWKPDYILHHLLPIVALWDLRNPQLSPSLKLGNEAEHDDAVSLVPIRIVKKRTVQFIPCYEVEWKRLGFDIWSLKSGLSTRIVDPNVMNMDSPCDLVDCYKFSVPVVDFQSHHSEMCVAFEAELCRRKPRTKRPPARQAVQNIPDVDQSDRVALTNLMHKLNLRDPGCGDANKKSPQATIVNPKQDARPIRHIPRWDTDSDSDLDTDVNKGCYGQKGDRTSTAQLSTLRKSVSMGLITEINEDQKHPDFSSAFHLNCIESLPIVADPGNFKLQSSLLTPSPLASQIAHAHSRTISLLDISESAFDQIKTPVSLRERLAKMF
ncbi:putative xp-G/rad2 DNA repair endonuclease family member, partial [Fasciola gigantica]